MKKILKLLLSVLLVATGLVHDAVKAKKSKNLSRFELRLKSLRAGDKQSLYDKKLKRVRYFKDRVIVKFKPDTNKSTVKKYILKNNLRLISKIGKRTYAFAIPSAENKPEQVIKFLETEGRSEEAYPGYEAEEDEALEEVDIDEYRQVETHAKKRRRSNVKLFADQWYLKNSGQSGLAGADINVEDAWRFTKGLGIKVAVIDTGFDLGHKDINFYSQGYDISADLVGAAAPNTSSENHGTAVAGIIAALDDDQGVVGVAPKAQIIPIRLIADGGSVSVSQIIAAHQKAVELGADVINNSWGSFDPTLGPNESLSLTELEEEMYREVAEEANDGKGVVVIFAAGNSSKSNFNGAPEARYEYNFAVGATNNKDQRASYSVYGEELDLVAPGGDSAAGLVTTDRRDLRKVKNGKRKRKVLGYDRGDFALSFTGTSAAAPVVAGVAALILSVNPSLTADQVKEILKLSARRDLGEKYSFTNNKNNELGYGIVDAGAAVRLAMTY